MREMLKALYRYRGFVKTTVLRDFQVRYQRSMLGALWLILQPLAMILVYTLIFTNVMRAKLPGIDSAFAYSIYLCAGILTWGLFTEILGRSTNTFIENANLLKKLSFPRIALPVIVVITALLNFLITFGLFTLFLVVTGNFPGMVYFLILPVLMTLVLFVTGLGIVLGILNVFFRDVGQLMGIVIQFWFWLTPIVYPIDILPEWARQLLVINPIMPIIVDMQTILVNGDVPAFSNLWYPALLGVCLLMLGLRLFRRHVGEIVDEI